MSCIFLLLLLPPQDARKSDVDMGAARRMTTVETITAEPPKLRLTRLAPAEPDPSRRTLIVEPRVPHQPDDPEGAGAVVPAGFLQMGVRGRALSSMNFDRWMFEDEEDARLPRAKLDQLLEKRLEAARKIRQLNPEHLRKLHLAGSGDIKRTLDRVEQKRSEFESVRRDFTEGRQFLMQLEPLARDFRIGPFDDQSLFAKTLRKIDEDERRAQYRTK
jgi:hypothetical protein